MKDALERVVIEELDRLGYDFVELKLGGSRGRPVYEVRIDRLDGQKVTVDDCAKASRALEARLDADPAYAGSRYVLEVSSPGMDRRLRRAADWRRFTGRKANVKANALGGRVEVEIIGVDGSDGNEVITVRDAGGVEHRIAIGDVADARLAVHWS